MSEVYLVQFKGSRKGYYYNPNYLNLKLEDYVIVQVERGEDMGRVVKKSSEELILNEEKKPSNILHKATPDDIERLKANREKEEEALKECERMIGARNLEMKLVDAEFQFDCNKITFYFTADKRIDFRELVKELASVYKTRIELRQIGVRDEARWIGGYGCCGLKVCCSTFIKGFEPISTQLAKEQNLSLNPAKISGNCGRLLCCLLYEKDFYHEAFSSYPKVGSKYQTDKEEGIVDNVNPLGGYIVVRHQDETEEKVSLLDIRKGQKKKHLPRGTKQKSEVG
ncbi:MAG TPA: regulatory iron-sulfur-containing complex subunit RicT [candidate division Zixibacteria bacterium]